MLNVFLVTFIVVLNQQSFDRFVNNVKSGGTVIANSTLVAETKPREDIHYVFAPMGELANDLGTSKVTNIISLGVLASVADIISKNALKLAVEKVLGSKKKELLPLNLKALEVGSELVANV